MADKTPLSGKQKAAIYAKNPPQDKLHQAAAKNQSAASVAIKDPDAAPDDQDAHTLHGAKLLSAIADAHVNNLRDMAQKKKAAPKPPLPGQD